jgi:rod shape-determining protein MreC
MPRSIRDIAIALLLVGGGLLILLSAPREPVGGPVSRALYTVMRPFQEAAAGVHSKVANLWNSYADLVGVRQENVRLKKELGRLLAERTVLMNTERENQRLKKLLGLRAASEFPTLVAQVIGEDASGWYRTVFLNRGSDDGVKTNMAVSVTQGLVGRVARTSPHMAQVILITDPELSVDCRVARTRDRGVLSGSLDRGAILRYINMKSAIRPGDQVVTSGLDGVFPRGLVIGIVDSVSKGTHGLFLEARVVPAVDFSEIEEVIIILGLRGGFDLRSGLEREH